MNMLSRHWEIAKAALADDRERVKARIESGQTEFLPAALEIVERPVSPTARLSAYVLAGGLALAIAWAFFGKLDVVSSAQGRLIPVDNVKLIQSSDAGVVRSILVHDGQQVYKGQVLVELDPTATAADTAQARSALQTALLEVARANAVLGAFDGKGLTFAAPEGTPPEVAATQQALALAEWRGLEASIDGRGSDRSAAIAARNEAATQVAKLNETIPLIDEQLAAYEELLAKGYAPKLKVIELRRQRLATIRDRDAALQAERKAAAQLAGAGSNVVQSRAEARAKVLDDLAKAQADAALKQEELVKTEQRSRLQQLVAPVDGTVAQLSIHTIGGVVEPAKPLMMIVPRGGSLVAEVKLLNKDVGSVQQGQAVAIKLEAFPFTRYGTVPGHVEIIGSDAIEDEKLGFVYTARVRLDRDTIDLGNEKVKLGPGMAVTADIRTGSRSIISYLVSPIDQARQEAGRER